MKKNDVEKSIIKKFRKEIWSKFVKAIKEYNLIEPGDKIAVCLSGGKDGILLALLLTELKRHGKFEFDLEFISMDPGFSDGVLSSMKENYNNLNIPVHIFKTDVFEVTRKHGDKYPCFLCARMRRGYLYDEARKMGCNKMALGHHMNDVVETVMMNLIYNGKFDTMRPILDSENFVGMKLIRPMYFILEKDIIKWKNYNNLSFADCACEGIRKESSGKREVVKALIEDLKKENKDIEKAIVNATGY